MRVSAVAVIGMVVLGLGLACSGVPGETCTMGTTKCETNVLSVCGADGAWQKTMDCPAGTSCGTMSGVDACVPEGAGDAPGGGGGKAGKRKAGGAH